jgi:hypothetical protein
MQAQKDLMQRGWAGPLGRGPRAELGDQSTIVDLSIFVMHSQGHNENR